MQVRGISTVCRRTARDKESGHWIKCECSTPQHLDELTWHRVQITPCIFRSVVHELLCGLSYPHIDRRIDVEERGRDDSTRKRVVKKRVDKLFVTWIKHKGAGEETVDKVGRADQRHHLLKIQTIKRFLVRTEF